MRLIPPKESLLQAIGADPNLQAVTLERLGKDYEAISRAFHSHFTCDSEYHHQNARFHKIRYLDLLSRNWNGRVLDLGDDKPFLSYFLKQFNRGVSFETVSNEIPETPFPLYEVDIEREPFPFPEASFDQVIFTEVIEHLWRNPSHCVFEINRVLKSGGELYVTTPNPCDRHSLVCILWQANPNQRSGYYATLESGHLHLWTVEQLKELLEQHGFEMKSVTTRNLYGHTKEDPNIERFIAEISPYRDLMNEAVVIEAAKARDVPAPVYPLEIFPDGRPVQVQGAIVGLLEAYLAGKSEKGK
jgi:SAM-dependent methyltransferase